MFPNCCIVRSWGRCRRRRQAYVVRSSRFQGISHPAVYPRRCHRQQQHRPSLPPGVQKIAKPSRFCKGCTSTSRYPRERGSQFACVSCFENCFFSRRASHRTGGCRLFASPRRPPYGTHGTAVAPALKPYSRSATCSEIDLAAAADNEKSTAVDGMLSTVVVHLYIIYRWCLRNIRYMRVV